VEPKAPESIGNIGDVENAIPDFAGLLEEENGVITVNEEVAMQAAEQALISAGLDAELEDVFMLPIFKATVTPGSVAAVGFAIQGDKLLAEYVDKIRLVKILSPDSGELFEYVVDLEEEPDLDKKFTLQLGADIQSPDTEIDLEADYTLVLFIRDDGEFDLNKTPGIVVDPVTLARALEADGKRKSRGCDAGVGMFGMLTLAALLGLRKGKK